MNAPRQRSAARLIVLDAERRVLLFRYERDSGESFWATPGGGLEPGETFEQAATREAFEELGACNISLGYLSREETSFIQNGHAIQQEERFFLVTSEAIVIESGVSAAHRSEGILEWRWWAIAELGSTCATIYPQDLADRVRSVCGMISR